MDYKELTHIVDSTQITDDEVKRSFGGSLAPASWQSKPSQSVLESIGNYVLKLCKNANSFNRLFKFGRKKVKGVQYFVVAVVPPQIKIANDRLTYVGTYDKDGKLRLCYKPESGNWRQFNAAPEL